MNTKEFIELTKQFKKQDGFRYRKLDKNTYLFTKQFGTSSIYKQLMYFYRESNKKTFKEDLKNLNEQYPEIPGGEEGQRFFLSSSPLGKIPKTIKEYKFKYQIPVWFFDREYSSEKSKRPLKKVIKSSEEIIKKRIKQPFKFGNDQGEDLLEELFEELKDPQEPSLRIIIAPAGYGKTYLMNTLFKKLLDFFMRNKKKGLLGRRPYLMTPGHLKDVTAYNIDDLIRGFNELEYDFGAANVDIFKFWVRNNLGIWLLDGLEEFIIKSPDKFIFELFEDYLGHPKSKQPQILITIRKPVLATSENLRKCISDYRDMGIDIYELCNWNKDDYTKYFQKNLSLSKNELNDFIKVINDNKMTRELCGVPYYCSLIGDLKENNKWSYISNEQELLEKTFDYICQREFGKGIDKDVYSKEKQKDIFVCLVEEYLDDNKISVDSLEDWAQMPLDDFSEDDKEAQLEAFKRHALLTSYEDNLNFIHDIWRDYFIGLFLLDELKNIRLEKFDFREIKPDSLIMRIINGNQENGFNWNSILEELFKYPQFESNGAIIFRNVMNIALNNEHNKNIVQDYLHSLEQLNGKNLTNLVFEDIDFNNFGFKYSRLSSTKFINCDLSDANFNDCILENTDFNSSNLEGATFKHATIESLKWNNRTHTDLNKIKQRLHKKTKKSFKKSINCGAVSTLKWYLEKLGTKHRGYSIRKDFLPKSRKGRVKIPDCLNYLIKYDVLSEDDSKDYVQIRYSKYEKVTKFVKNPNLLTDDELFNNILDEICPDKNVGCKHFY